MWSNAWRLASIRLAGVLSSAFFGGGWNSFYYVARSLWYGKTPLSAFGFSICLSGVVHIIASIRLTTYPLSNLDHLIDMRFVILCIDMY